ncbi:MAG: FkbM family methyltransferase [Verrucomicrobiota bacterium]
MQWFNKAPYVYRPAQVLRRMGRCLCPPSSAVVNATLPWGMPITIDPRETIGRTIWHAGVHDLDVCEALYRLADPDEVALDIGANIGQMTCVLALRVGGAGRVLAFEPHPVVFQRLSANLARWRNQPGVATLEAFPWAVSDAPGEVSLIESADFAHNQGTATLGASGINSAKEHRVRAATLAEICRDIERVGVVKMDVEGHEVRVLHGGAELLRQHRIRSVIFEDDLAAGSKTVAVFQQYGYEVFVLEWRFGGVRLHPVREWRPTLAHGTVPSCVATCDPQDTLRRFATTGWQVLAHR